MHLLEKQQLFCKLLPRLLDEIYALGYSATFGEAFRPPEMVAIHAANGKGSTRSVHPLRLAVDINLFKNAVYLRATEDHKTFGGYWVALHPLCRWGGNFDKSDGNHYSLTHGGRA